MSQTPQEDVQRELHREMLRQLQLRQQSETQQAQQLQQAQQFAQDPERQHNKALAMQFMQQMMSSDAQQSWDKYQAWI